MLRSEGVQFGETNRAESEPDQHGGQRWTPVTPIPASKGGTLSPVVEALVRPQMDQHMQQRHDDGKKRPYPGASRSWFERGGLGADGSGLYLIDADRVYG